MALTPVDVHDGLQQALEKNFRLTNEKERREAPWYSRIVAQMSRTLVTICCGRSVAEIREENILLRSSALQYKRAASEAYRDGVSAIARLTRELACQHQISTSLGCALDKARGEIASLVELAHNDPLTGLFNRRGLDDRLAGIASAFSHAGKEDEISGHHQSLSLECSVVYIDLDKFKPVNDTYGHNKGDEVLRSFANLLRQTFARHADLIARVGGDEFIVIMTNSDREGAAKQAQMVLDRMREGNDFHIRGTEGMPEYQVSASVGIAPMVLQAQPGGLSIEAIESGLSEAVRRADAAMFEVKRSVKPKRSVGIARRRQQ